MEQSDYVTLIKPNHQWGKWSLVRSLENGKLYATRKGAVMGEIVLYWGSVKLYNIQPGYLQCTAWHEMPEAFMAAVKKLIA